LLGQRYEIQIKNIVSTDAVFLNEDQSDRFFSIALSIYFYPWSHEGRLALRYTKEKEVSYCHSYMRYMGTNKYSLLVQPPPLL